MRNAQLFWLVALSAFAGCGDVRSEKSDASVGVGIDAAVIIDAGTACPQGAICGAGHNFAFVTSEERPAGSIGGLEPADEHCNRLANQAGLPGQYIAFLSTETEDARSRLGTANGWLRTDRRPFALNQQSLFEDELILYPLSLDENGLPAFDGLVGTATDLDGKTFGDSCQDWTNEDAGFVRVGLSAAADFDWTRITEAACSEKVHMYCFGIDNSQPIVVPPAKGRLAWLSNDEVPANTGLATMDSICQTEAQSLGLSSAKAFLSTTSEAAANRFDLSGPTWVRPDGVVLWESAQDVAFQSPLAPIMVKANGIPRGALVWTGAKNASLVSLSNGQESCRDWTSAVVTDGGNTGHAAYNGVRYFNDRGAESCSALRHLYCFEE